MPRRTPSTKKTAYHEPPLQLLPRLGLRPAVVLRVALWTLLLYVLVVGLTAISVYHKKADTPWNRAVDHIFPYPAAVVSGEVIPMSRVWEETDALQYHNAKHGIASKRSDTQQFVLDQISDRILYKQALGAHGLNLTDADVDKQMQSIYTDAGGQDKLVKFLADDYGPSMTLDRFREWIVKESLYEAAVQQQLLVRVSVSHIVVAVQDGATPDQVAAARQKAVDIKAKIATPDDFAAAAKQYSEDVASRDKGGDLGTTSRGNEVSRYGQDFENAIFSLPVNTVSDPIRSTIGWHLVKVTKKEGSIDKSLKDYTADLRSAAHMRFFVGHA